MARVQQTPIDDWRKGDRPITVAEAEEVRLGLLKTIEMFPLQILSRLRQYMEFEPWHIAALASGIARASVVHWDSKLWDTALKGSEVFVGQHFNPNDLHPELQLWVPDVDLFFEQQSIDFLQLGRNSVVSCLLISRRPNSIDICGVCVPPGSMARKVLEEDIPLIEVVPTFRFWIYHTDEPIATPFGANVAALLKFMNLPFVSMAEHKPSRPVRRAMERKGKKWPDVRYIVLRRNAPDHMHKGVPKGEKKVDWSCQWLVSPHWRDQYYKSEDTHKPVFIEGYLKGPEGKPLKPPAKTIYTVRR